jgi:hypothetical protein
MVKMAIFGAIDCTLRDQKLQKPLNAAPGSSQFIFLSSPFLFLFSYSNPLLNMRHNLKIIRLHETEMRIPLPNHHQHSSPKNSSK